MIKNKEFVKEGDVVWYCCTSFTKTFKTYGCQKPIEVQIVAFNSLSGISRVKFSSGLCSTVSIRMLYLTEEEAWESWNKSFKHQIELLEERKRILEKKIKE